MPITALPREIHAERPVPARATHRTGDQKDRIVDMANRLEPAPTAGGAGPPDDAVEPS